MAAVEKPDGDPLVRAIDRCRREGWTVGPIEDDKWRVAQGGIAHVFTAAELLVFAGMDGGAPTTGFDRVTK